MFKDYTKYVKKFHHLALSIIENKYPKVNNQIFNSSLNIDIMKKNWLLLAVLCVFSGVFVKGSTTAVDILMVGNIASAKVKSLMKDIEKIEGREINYCVLSYDEFYYRLSVRDRFITEIVNGVNNIVIDKDNIIKKKLVEK